MQLQWLDLTYYLSHCGRGEANSNRRSILRKTGLLLSYNMAGGTGRAMCISHRNILRLKNPWIFNVKKIQKPSDFGSEKIIHWLGKYSFHLGFIIQSNLVIRNILIRNKLVLRNHFTWPICHFLHKDKKHLALRNYFRLAKKLLITKFDCTIKT
jgi:hypothetical protein